MLYSGLSERINPELGAKREFGKRSRYPHMTRADDRLVSGECDGDRQSWPKHRARRLRNARWRDAAWNALDAGAEFGQPEGEF